MSGRSSGLKFYKNKKRVNSNLVRQIFSFIFIGMVSCLVAFVSVYCFGIKTNVIGISMNPTLKNGEEIFINRFIYFMSNPKKNDVIVFLPNGNDNSHYYVKRIIGVPGDKVVITNGLIYVNDSLYEDEQKYDKIEDGGIATNGVILGEDEFFVLGDNRNNSEDSRSSNIGVVKKDYIKGKAWLHYNKSDAENKIGFIK